MKYSDARDKLLSAIRFPSEHRDEEGVCVYSCGPDLLGDWHQMTVMNFSDKIVLVMTHKPSGEKWGELWQVEIDLSAERAFISGARGASIPNNLTEVRNLARATLSQIGRDDVKWRKPGSVDYQSHISEKKHTQSL